jgi:hypothetical protein
MKLIIALAAMGLFVACGSEEAAQQYYACWDDGSALAQALGPDPHVPRNQDRNWHWCYKDNFIKAGWQPAPGHSPVEWMPPSPPR